MKRLLLALALFFAPPETQAQNITCATRPVGDNSNACASTAFVNNGFVTGFGTAGYVLTGNGASAATFQGFTQLGTGAVTLPWITNGQTWVSAKQFGAVGDGIADDTTALQNAINAVASQTTNLSLYIPKGVYKTTSPLVISGPAAIYGDGFDIIGIAGTIIQPAVGINGINITGQPAVNLSNFGVRYTSAASGGTTAINFDSGGGAAYNYYSRVNSVGIYNAYNGMILRQTFGIVVDKLYIQEYGNVGVVISDDNSNGDQGDATISGSTISSFTIAPTIGCLYWTSAGGLKWHGNKCLGSTDPAKATPYGAQLNLRSGADSTQLNFAGNSFDNISVAALQYTRQAGGVKLQGLTFNSNNCNNVLRCFYVPNDAAGVALKTVSIVGNTMLGSNSASASLINIDSTDNVIIEGNALSSANAATIGLSLNAAATNVAVGPVSTTGTFASTYSLTGIVPKISNAVTPTAGGVMWTNSSVQQVTASPTSTGQLLQSTLGGAPTWSTAIYPATATATGTILRADGTNWVVTNSTWPTTTTINQILYSSAANTVAGLASANTGALITSSAGVPSITSGGTANRVLRTDGTTVSFAQVAAATDISGQLPLANGGTAANLTASNGGIFYSTASAGAILSGTATANQMLQSGTNTTPAWSTTTWPATTTINRLLWSSAANVISDLATANSSVLVTSGSGVPSLSTSLPNNLTIPGNLNISGAAGTFRSITFQTSASNRWLYTADSTAESGANAGTNFDLNSYDDTGTFLATVMQVIRSSGDVKYNSTDDATAPATGALQAPNGGISAGKNIFTGTHFLNGSAAPAASTCGTSPVVATGSTNQGGQVTTGTANPTACTVTFNAAYPNYAFCTISPANAAASGATVLPYVSASSKTAFTITMAVATNSAAFNYACNGN